MNGLKRSRLRKQMSASNNPLNQPPDLVYTSENNMDLYYSVRKGYRTGLIMACTSEKELIAI